MPASAPVPYRVGVISTGSSARDRRPASRPASRPAPRLHAWLAGWLAVAGLALLVAAHGLSFHDAPHSPDSLGHDWVLEAPVPGHSVPLSQGTHHAAHTVLLGVMLPSAPVMPDIPLILAATQPGLALPLVSHSLPPLRRPPRP